MINVDGLEKYYGKYRALEDVTFEVKEGEILGLLGPNGAGKTTIMRILTTFLPLSGGNATVSGYDIVKQPMEVRKCVGYMPENPPLYKDMKVIQFFRFLAGLKRIPHSKIRDRIDYVVDVCRLEDVKNNFIFQLSKGYRQRVGLASALIADPPVLILDEPTIGLDPKQTKYTRELIKDFGDSHTVLVSTHILPEAEMICDRFAVIDKGKIIAVGTPSELAGKIRKINAIRVELSGPPDEVSKAIQKLDGVTSIIPCERPGIFLVEFEQSSETREHITLLALERNWTILELSPQEVSLEEVFLELVTDEGKG